MALIEICYSLKTLHLKTDQIISVFSPDFWIRLSISSGGIFFTRPSSHIAIGVPVSWRAKELF
jgi:hypothetical protein